MLRRRRALIAVCVLIAPGAALGASLAQEEQYSASASLLFRDPALDQKLFGSQVFSSSSDPTREAATNVRLVSLDVVAHRTDRRVPSAAPVRRKIDVAAEGQSDVVSVTATDRNPGLAARIANTFAEEYIAFRREADRTKIRDAEQLVAREISQLAPEERAGSNGQSLRQRADELQILASLQTGNAELVERASPPSTPSSPKPIRNTLLGAVLGIMLGLGLALLRDRLDRRIREPKEAEEIFDRPFLGVIPEIKALANRRSAQTLEGPGNAVEAFRMLRANLRYFNIDRDIRSVLVTSSAPGDGKTTVCWNLASAAASGRARVLLIEADLRHPTLGTAVGVVGTPGLSTVLSGGERLRHAVEQIPVGERRNGGPPPVINVLFAGPLPPNPADLLESDRMHELIREAEQEYELVIIDTPPTAVVSDAVPLVTQVGGVIVVTRLGKTTREDLLRLRNQLANLDAPVLGLVANAMNGGGEAYGYGYEAPENQGEDRASGGPRGLASKSGR